MCTLLVAHNIWPEVPLIVAANRDEFYDRPSLPPAIQTTPEGPIFCPLDQVSKGTWLGINPHGVFAGLTNRFGNTRKKSSKSRGLIVLKALQHATTMASKEALKTLIPEKYTPFHLLIADKKQAFIIWSDGKQLYDEELQPGIHMVTERSFNAAHTDREELLKEELKNLNHSTPPKVKILKKLLSIHQESSFEGTCVHLPKMNYGTRSSTIIVFKQDGPPQFLYADGPPCTSRYDEYNCEFKSWQGIK